jgi:limonene-1,2-epoxide hydrolase
VGVLDIRNGKVREWREYYDRASLLREMGVSPGVDPGARK